MLKKLLRKTPSNINIKKHKEEEQSEVPNLWIKCSKCGELLYKEDVKQNAYVCTKCGGYFRLNAKQRLRLLVDKGSFEAWDEEIETPNPLCFEGYLEKLSMIREKTGLKEGILTGKARIAGYETVIGVMDSRFFMGSMGYVVGEKITRAVERATQARLPVILICCSGGARMQEGIVSLMQMEKTAAALKRHSNQGLLSISILTDPTTGGVTASFAMLADIILAEPKALIGFAGTRVIEQTIHQKLPEGFQRAEFLQEHGFLDRVVARSSLKETLAKILQFHDTQRKPFNLHLEESTIRKITYKRKKNAWEMVMCSRKAERLTALDYIQHVFTGFLEFHGDRYAKDDGAIVGGVAMFGNIPVTVIGQQKGKNLNENLARNFGMPSPEGYRKALRLMKQAEKFHRPIICFVDTPGAFCGIEAEERGQGRAIADNLFQMSDLKTPILSIVIGEGGSGGALAMAVADEVWMMERAVYSILSPEGFASILWKDGKRANEAAERMKMTATDLLELGITEKILPERQEATLEHIEFYTKMMQEEIRGFLSKYLEYSKEELLAHRYERFRNL